MRYFNNIKQSTMTISITTISITVFILIALFLLQQYIFYKILKQRDSIIENIRKRNDNLIKQYQEVQKANQSKTSKN